MQRKTFIVAAFALCIAAQMQQAGAQDISDKAVALTPGEVYAMYAGKTQSYRDDPGGWYYSPDRKLAALGKKSGYAHGRWWITDSGRLCMDATWVWGKKAADRSKERACYAHAKVGKEIWKRYTQGGKWRQWSGKDNESALFTDGYLYGEQVNERRDRFGS